MDRGRRAKRPRSAVVGVVCRDFAERPLHSQETEGGDPLPVIRVGIAMSAFWSAIDNTRHYRPGVGAQISTD